MPLPLTVSCFSKTQVGFTFLVPAHPGSPGQRAVKRVCVCVCKLYFVVLLSFLHFSMIPCCFSDTSKIKPCHNLDNNSYLLLFFLVLYPWQWQMVVVMPVVIDEWKNDDVLLYHCLQCHTFRAVCSYVRMIVNTLHIFVHVLWTCGCALVLLINFIPS